jgi:hypothetical protein
MYYVCMYISMVLERTLTGHAAALWALVFTGLLFVSVSSGWAARVWE